MIMDQIWERRPGESARAYAAFCMYRDLPPRERSLTRVAEDIAKASTKQRHVASIRRRLSDWSSKWNWVERAAAWDEERDRIARQAQIEAIKEMRERHASEAMMLQKKALDRLRAMDARELAPNDVLRYLIEAAKLERLARGEPETVEEQRHDLTGLAAIIQAAWKRRRDGDADGKTGDE